MKISELIKFIQKKSFKVEEEFGVKFYYIENENFNEIKHNFLSHFNLVWKWENYRSKHYFLHAHAVKQEKETIIHFDKWNVSMFFPLWIIHLITDITPYVYKKMLSKTRR